MSSPLCPPSLFSGSGSPTPPGSPAGAPTQAQPPPPPPPVYPWFLALPGQRRLQMGGGPSSAPLAAGASTSSEVNALPPTSVTSPRAAAGGQVAPGAVTTSPAKNLPDTPVHGQVHPSPLSPPKPSSAGSQGAASEPNPLSPSSLFSGPTPPVSPGEAIPLPPPPPAARCPRFLVIPGPRLLEMNVAPSARTHSGDLGGISAAGGLPSATVQELAAGEPHAALAGKANSVIEATAAGPQSASTTTAISDGKVMRAGDSDGNTAEAAEEGVSHQVVEAPGGFGRAATTLIDHTVVTPAALEVQGRQGQLVAPLPGTLRVATPPPAPPTTSPGESAAIDGWDEFERLLEKALEFGGEPESKRRDGAGTDSSMPSPGESATNGGTDDFEEQLDKALASSKRRLDLDGESGGEREPKRRPGAGADACSGGEASAVVAPNVHTSFPPGIPLAPTPAVRAGTHPAPHKTIRRALWPRVPGKGVALAQRSSATWPRASRVNVPAWRLEVKRALGKPVHKESESEVAQDGGEKGGLAQDVFGVEEAAAKTTLGGGAADEEDKGEGEEEYEDEDEDEDEEEDSDAGKSGETVPGPASYPDNSTNIVHADKNLPTLKFNSVPLPPSQHALLGLKYTTPAVQATFSDSSTPSIASSATTSSLAGTRGRNSTTSSLSTLDFPASFEHAPAFPLNYGINGWADFPQKVRLALYRTLRDTDGCSDIISFAQTGSMVYGEAIPLLYQPGVELNKSNTTGGRTRIAAGGREVEACILYGLGGDFGGEYDTASERRFDLLQHLLPPPSQGTAHAILPPKALLLASARRVSIAEVTTVRILHSIIAVTYRRFRQPEGEHIEDTLDAAEKDSVKMIFRGVSSVELGEPLMTAIIQNNMVKARLQLESVLGHAFPLPSQGFSEVSFPCPTIEPKSFHHFSHIINALNVNNLTLYRADYSNAILSFTPRETLTVHVKLPQGEDGVDGECCYGGIRQMMDRAQRFPSAPITATIRFILPPGITPLPIADINRYIRSPLSSTSGWKDWTGEIVVTQDAEEAAEVDVRRVARELAVQEMAHGES
ncbi:hypothetical protein IAT38_003264 [Cryptococcus sp. DSM 104549]